MNALDRELGFHETALSLRGYRQQILASNVANADTPNYKARDIDFAQALSTATARAGAAAAGPQQAPLQMQGGLIRTSALHLSGSGANAAAVAAGLTQAALKYRNPLQSSVDGNTVEMDMERNQFVNNAVHYEASLTFLSGQTKTLLSALQG